MPNTKHNTNELSNSSVGKLGTTGKSLLQVDYALDGPSIIQDPSFRIMTGAVSTAHAAEQAAAITAAGGITGTNLKGKVVSEIGKQLGA